MKGRFWRKALAAALALLIVSGSTPIQPLSQVFEDIAITASAESTITPETPQLDIDGFYSIGTAAELYGFAELVNNGNATANAKLTADIVVNENVLDANGEANTGDFVQWTPIGNDFFEGKVYSGTFDGQGHTVSGLYVSGSGWRVGLIGAVSGSAVVKNLGIVDSYFSSSNNLLGSIVGGVANNSSVTLANVYSTSTVKGDNWIGGLAGGGDGSVSVVNSYFAGKTSANWAYGTHHDDLVAGDFDKSTLTVCNAFVLGTSQYGTSVTAEQLSDGTVAAALHYYQDALADGSMFGLSGGKTNFSGTIDGVSVTTANITLHTFDGDATAYSSKYIVGNTTPLPVNVEREGYTFFGWYDNADLEGDAVTSISSSETGNKEYWAKFERSHAVSFVLGGGTIRSGEIDHYIEGETTVLPTYVTKVGASFEGWYTTEDFTGSRYYSIPSTATEDMTFYAKWGEEKTTFYLRQGPETVNILYEGENLVWLDETTTERYVISDNFYNYWSPIPGINVPYTGGASTFDHNISEISVAQSGFYVFTLTDMGDESWFVSILKSMLNCDVASIPTQVYTGSAIEPAVTVKDGETTLTLGTDYTVSYSDNTNAGTAKATITGKGNYSGTVEKTFAINKATPTVTAPTANTLTYNGGEQELVTAGSTNFGKVLYSLDGTNYSEEVPKGTNAGKYTVYYKVDTDNYYYAPQTVEVTIAEAYTITWKNGDETVETDNYVPSGATPEYNGNAPTKGTTAQYTYTFSGWSDGTNTYASNALPTVSGNVTYTAQFSKTVNKYTVTWKNGDTVLETDENVEYGATPEYNGETPTKEGNAQYTYPFSGWSPEVDTVTGNVTYTAQFSQSVNKYNITWVDGDGNTLKTDQVAYGETPVYAGDTPTKTATAQYSYTFTGWNTTPASVTGNATYTAQFSQTTREYAVTWVDGNGDTLKTDQVAYGETPAYTGDTPTKTATAQYTYTFNETWDTAISAVTGDVTYTAQFDRTVNKYTVTWKNENGTALETDENVEYGTMPEYNGATPTKASTSSYTYSFAGWSPAVSSVKGDVTYTATFTAHSTYVPPTYYTITYKVDGEVYQTASSTSGSKITLIDEPTKEGYTFSGWQTSYTTMPASNIEITGTFAINTYAVTYMVDGAQYGDSATVEHGTKLTAPEAPTKNGAIFLGWTADGVNAYDFETPVTAETTLTAMWLDASGFITFSEGYAVTDDTYNGTDRDYVGFRFDVNMDNSNYTVVQHGILYGMNIATFSDGKADANLRFTDEEATALMDKVREFAAQNTDTETTDWIEVYIGDRRDGVVYARGFIIVTDGTNNYLIYSDVQEGSYNSFSE